MALGEDMCASSSRTGRELSMSFGVQWMIS